ncbi:unnamed protein product [Sphagnum jensenii]
MDATPISCGEASVRAFVSPLRSFREKAAGPKATHKSLELGASMMLPLSRWPEWKQAATPSGPKVRPWLSRQLGKRRIPSVSGPWH